jgi:hypothetical protein
MDLDQHLILRLERDTLGLDDVIAGPRRVAGPGGDLGERDVGPKDRVVIPDRVRVLERLLEAVLGRPVVARGERDRREASRGLDEERFAERTSELMASMSASSRRWLRLLRRRARGMAALVRDGMQRDTRPTLELSRGCDFDDGDVADTARVPTPVPSKDPPAKRAPSVRLDPKPRKTSQRDITTQVIDLRKRRSSSLPRPDKVISVSDLFLPAGTPKPGT